MNLARMLRQRAEAGRPVRVGIIGAGKFSSMFLAQARTTRGSAPGRACGPRARARAPGAEEHRLGRAGADRQEFLRGAFERQDRRDRRRQCADRLRHRSAGRHHRQSGGGHAAYPARVRARPARGERHGRSRRAGRAAARRAREEGRRRLCAGVRRPAGAGVRDGGLGRGLRLPRGRGGERHQVSAGLSSIDARYGVDAISASPPSTRAKRA